MDAYSIPVTAAFLRYPFPCSVFPSFLLSWVGWSFSGVCLCSASYSEDGRMGGDWDFCRSGLAMM